MSDGRESAYKGKDLLGLRDLSSSEIFYILDVAREMKGKIDDLSQRDDTLGKTSVVTLFYEDSTRTKMSFLMAGEYLGAKVDDLGIQGSSVNKGESLIDTGINLDQMGINTMILRHKMTGAAHLLAKNVKASVINAGDGSNEHPTQALLDLFTIKEHLGGFDGLKVAILGDISHSRVARSNVFGLTKLGAKVTLAGPSTLLSGAMAKINENVTVTSDIKEAVFDADIVMGLRVQLERQKAAAFPDLREYAAFFGITEEIMRFAKPNAIVMHPGPMNRGVELSAEVIDSKQSVIYAQAKNGVAVRMALLKILAENQERGSAL